MIDDAARRAEQVASARASLADLFGRHERVFAAFSGGKDSLTLAHLCEPWRDRLTLLWVNTGHFAPFMVEFVRGHAGRYDLVEITPERPMMDQWAEFGLPADILPLEHIAGVDWRTPRLQPWINCCGVNRNQPLWDYLERYGRPCGYLHGQRASDRAATSRGLSTVVPVSTEVALPLFSWSTADVLAYVEAHGVQLHPHHAECPTSIECICCPANLVAEEQRLHARIHPEVAAATRARIRGMLGLAARKANEIVGIVDAIDGGAPGIRR